MNKSRINQAKDKVLECISKQLEGIVGKTITEHCTKSPSIMEPYKSLLDAGLIYFEEHENSGGYYHYTFRPTGNGSAILELYRKIKR